MTFGREKRTMLGLVALGVAIPLPLNQALDWFSLGLFVVTVGLFLRRTRTGSERWLSNRALNLLGLAYLPVLVFDVAAFGRLQPVRPILHLTLFGVAAKLWSLQRERDKWQAWIGLFFLFLAAMATSTHPSVVAYLFGFVAISVALLARFVHLHVLSAFAGQRAEAPALGFGRLVVAIVLATAAIAAPLFALLPRVRSPFVVGPGAIGGGTTEARMGFSDEMSLDLIGRIRGNREVAMRVELDGEHPPPGEMRFKARVYEGWEGRTWTPAPGVRQLRAEAFDERFALAPGRSVGRARIVLEPLRSAALVLPVETLSVEVAALRLLLSDGGSVSLSGMPGRVLEYTALLAAGPVSTALPPSESVDSLALSGAGITPEMVRLAADWAGQGSAGDRATKIEQRFARDFDYSTEFVGRGGASPIEDFLFRSRRGHCEYFASAMVLLLRAQGIPARLATGFYGAEWSPWEGVWVVRQSNAHAWVEAWLPEEGGWTVFDPTPPDGRPSASPEGFATSIRQAWEAVVSRWDRWVISYDFDDQVGVFGDLRAWWSELVRRLTSGSSPESGSSAPPGASGEPGASTPETARAAARPLWPWLLATLMVAAGGAAWLLRRGGGWTPVRAYALLRATLAGAGLPVADPVAPLALARLVAKRLPAAGAPASRLIDVYVRATFGARAPSLAELGALRADLDAVERAVRAARRVTRATR